MSNKLKMKWSKKENDFIIYYPRKCDGNLTHYYLCCKRPSINISTKNIYDIDWLDSFVDELNQRGYDLTTLKFEVKLKE